MAIAGISAGVDFSLLYPYKSSAYSSKEMKECVIGKQAMVLGMASLMVGVCCNGTVLLFWKDACHYHVPESSALYLNYRLDYIGMLCYADCGRD